MSESSWESLRSDFTQLRRECAINPPIVTAGRLTAIWTVQVESEPAHWRLNYWNAKDGSGITERFRSRAKYAAARRGFKGSGDDAVNFWLDELKAYAPEPYVQRIASSNGPGLPDSLYSVEILDVCGLSADYCWECEADEILSRPGRAEAGSNLVNLFRVDASARPLGNNPFPEGYPVYAAFEEATWKAKTKIAAFKLEFVQTNFNTPTEFIQSLLTFRKRWFSAAAFEATLIVGNEETAQWYEHWIDERAKWLLEDTLSQARRKDPDADPAAPPFFSPDDLKHIESDLTFELLGMVTHYKGVAAKRVLEVIGLRNAAQAAAAGESKGVPSGSVSPAEGSPDSRVDDTPVPGTPEVAKADSAKNNRAPSPRPPLEAVAKDEERREKAREHLVRALQSYINKLGQAKDRDAHRETETFCDYARENYASRAEPYFEAMPPMDPQALFEVGDFTERRDLAGLPTIGNVFERVKDVKVRRPSHWPDPPIYRGDESPKLRRVLRELIIGEHESFEWLLIEPWDRWFRQQIRDCIKECVGSKRKEYERRFPSQPATNESKAAAHDNEKDDEPSMLMTRDSALEATSKPRLNVDLISKWMEDEGYTNEELAGYLDVSVRAVSSMRNDGAYHGSEALTKLANQMKRDVEDLYLP